MSAVLDTRVRCCVCVSPLLVVDDRTRFPHLTWCPHRRPRPQRLTDQVLLVRTPDVDPITHDETDSGQEDR